MEKKLLQEWQSEFVGIEGTVLQVNGDVEYRYD